MGSADAGKSTLLGVLTQGQLDNGRGRARLNMFRHLHEVQSGRTSSISHEILGFDTQVSTYSVCYKAPPYIVIWGSHCLDYEDYCLTRWISCSSVDRDQHFKVIFSLQFQGMIVYLHVMLFEVGGSRFLQNVCIYLQNCMVSCPEDNDLHL